MRKTSDRRDSTGKIEVAGAARHLLVMVETLNKTPPKKVSDPPERGSAVIKRALSTLPNRPGVYRMIGADNDVLYVGKAKNLRKRVATYAQAGKLGERTRAMVAATAALEVVTTHTDVEALLLESNLIKTLKPRYNVLLRDDKSFPYILVTRHHEWAQINKHRGARNTDGEYFGPFASAGAVNETLAALQRAFPLRSCSDSMFASRTRPCLQYQIKRCAAPCVGRISKSDYDTLLDEARDFLSGESQAIQKQLAERMQKASEALEFEEAGVYRDRIRALTQIQAHQGINVAGLGDTDVIAVHCEAGQACVQVFFFRGGQNYGNRAYFPTHARHLDPDQVLAAFLGQFYEDRPAPALVLLSHALAEGDLIARALSIRHGCKVALQWPRRGIKRRLVAHAATNAREALGRRLSESASQRRLLDGVAKAFGLPGPPRRIEVYDNSHISGTDAVGAMIVAGPDGLMKNAYRKFTIRSIGRTKPAGAETRTKPAGAETRVEPAGADSLAENDGESVSPGDDYGMIREVLVRRFSRALKEDPDRAAGSWPDLILIDGGIGHLNAALAVLADLGISDVAAASIAKGRDRNAGRERFFLAENPPFSLPPRDPVLYFLQRLRDEAHRFAIGTHRARRSRNIGRSLLDEIPGIGSMRKRALLHHFGSARAASLAGLDDLANVTGISRVVAKKIYDHFNDEG